MNYERFSETRTVQGFKVTPSRHFFLRRPGLFGHQATEMPGTIKIVRLRSGDYSIRSIGRKGSGVIFHAPGGCTLVVDGQDHTVASLYESLERGSR